MKREMLRTLFEKFMLPRVADDCSDVVQVQVDEAMSSDSLVTWVVLGKRGRVEGSLSKKQIEEVGKHADAIVAIIDDAARESAERYLNLRMRH